MITLTADFIRSLSGLSAAELPNSVIDSLYVLEIVEAAALNYPLLSEYDNLYYKGYKALTIIGPSLLLSLPAVIRDNFNQFSRFDNLKDLLEYADAKVAIYEGYNSDSLTLIDRLIPNIDPVIGNAR